MADNNCIRNDYIEVTCLLEGIKLKNILYILIGTALYSFGLVHFNMQYELAEGGFTGVTLILYFVLNWDPAIMNLVLNIPMFIIGWRLLGRKVFIYTIIATVSVSVFLKLFQVYQFNLHLEEDLLLVALFSGVSLGGGLGIVFRYGGTTGGVDIIARLVQKYAGWSMGKTMFLFDAVVLILSRITYLDNRTLMYTIVVVYLAARVIDFIQEGAYAARGAMIISDYNDEIAQRITKELDRGVTVLKGKGHYTNKDREVLYCVVSKSEIFRLKNIINSVDPFAFVTLMEVNDVLGEGFTLDEYRQPVS